MRNILITGGSGYLAGRLSEYLHKAGYSVTLVSSSQNTSANNFCKLIKLSSFASNYLDQICSGQDVVIHAAGMNSSDCLASPAAAIEVNGVLTARFVEAAKRAEVKKFIYISTAHVYKSPLQGKFDENSILKNLHPYASSHAAGEAAVMWASSTSDRFESIVLRLSNAFGIPIGNGSSCWILAVNDFVLQAVRDRRIIIRTDSDQYRDFIPLLTVNQVIDQLIRFHKNVSGIYNLSSGMSQTLYDMAKTISQNCFDIYGYSPEIVSLAGVGGAPKKNDLIINNNKIKSIGVEISDNFKSEIASLLSYCATFQK